MAITYTAGTTVEGTASVTSTTVTLPAGLADGDYTIIFFSLNASSGSITTPAGWTNILASTATVNGSTAGKHAIFYRKWVSGDGSVAVTTPSGRTCASPIKVSGADGTTLVNTAASVTQAASGATTLTSPSITPTSTNLVCSFMGRRATNGQFLTPFSNLSAGMTMQDEASAKAVAATNAGHCVATQQVTSGSATGTRQVDPVGSTTGAFGVAFALNAAAGGTPGDVAAVAATVDAAAPVPTVTAAASVLPPAATVTVEALVPSVSTAVVMPPAATATVAAPVPTVTAAAVILPPAASVTVDAPVPEVTGGGGAEPLALDASTPALDSASATATTTASFTPPADALVMAVVMASAGTQANPTVAITNTGGGLSSWTLVDRATVTTTGASGIGGGVATMHWAKVNTSAATTVTATQTSGSAPTYLKVWVITGADTTSPIGDTDIGFTTDNTMVTGTMTTTRDGSWKAAVGTEWSAAGTAGPNHPDLDIGLEGFDDTTDILVGACGAKEVPTSDSNVTATIDAAGGAAASREWLWVACEIKAAAGPSGTDYDKSVADTLGALDSASATQDLVRDVADTAGLTDAATRTVDAVRDHADALGALDAVALEQGRAVADTAGALDAVTVTQDLARTQSDAAGLLDSATAQQDSLRTVSDTAGITDSVDAFISKDVFPSDVAGLTDAATATLDSVRSQSDSAGLLDSATAQIDAVRAQADLAGITDATATEFGYGREVVEALGITDAMELAQAMFHAISDTLGITDSVSADLSGPSGVSIMDPLAITDSVWHEKIQATELADPEGLTDSATTQIERVHWPQDSASIADSVTAVQDAIRALADLSALSDEASRTVDAQRPPADSAGATDAVTATMGLVRDADDFAGLSDAVQTIMERFQPPLADTIALTDSVTAVLTLGSLHGYVFDAVPLATRWTIAALDERWAYIANTKRFSAVGVIDRYETNPLEVRWTIGPIPGENMASTDVLVSAGAVKYVGGTVTETTGKNISGATFQISLGSEFQPGRTWLVPDISTAGATNAERIVKYLVSSSTPSGLVVPGQYWAWVRVTDDPEIEPLRVQGPINVR